MRIPKIPHKSFVNIELILQNEPVYYSNYSQLIQPLSQLEKLWNVFAYDFVFRMSPSDIKRSFKSDTIEAPARARADELSGCFQGAFRVSQRAPAALPSHRVSHITCVHSLNDIL